MSETSRDFYSERLWAVFREAEDEFNLPEGRVWAALLREPGEVNFPEGSVAAQAALMDNLIARAADELEARNATATQLAGAQLKLRLIFLTAMSVREGADRRGETIGGQEALALSLTSLCPLWPFC